VGRRFYTSIRDQVNDLRIVDDGTSPVAQTYKPLIRIAAMRSCEGRYVAKALKRHGWSELKSIALTYVAKDARVQKQAPVRGHCAERRLGL
jgi:hypothetical protein